VVAVPALIWPFSRRQRQRDAHFIKMSSARPSARPPSFPAPAGSHVCQRSRHHLQPILKANVVARAVLYLTFARLADTWKHLRPRYVPVEGGFPVLLTRCKPCCPNPTCPSAQVVVLHDQSVSFMPGMGLNSNRMRANLPKRSHQQPPKWPSNRHRVRGPLRYVCTPPRLRPAPPLPTPAPAG
jgi:hypothetical protein